MKRKNILSLFSFLLCVMLVTSVTFVFVGCKDTKEILNLNANSEICFDGIDNSYTPVQNEFIFGVDIMNVVHNNDETIYNNYETHFYFKESSFKFKTACEATTTLEKISTLEDGKDLLHSWEKVTLDLVGDNSSWIYSYTIVAEIRNKKSKKVILSNEYSVATENKVTKKTLAMTAQTKN